LNRNTPLFLLLHCGYFQPFNKYFIVQEIFVLKNSSHSHGDLNHRTKNRRLKTFKDDIVKILSGQIKQYKKSVASSIGKNAIYKTSFIFDLLSSLSYNPLSSTSYWTPPGSTIWGMRWWFKLRANFMHFAGYRIVNFWNVFEIVCHFTWQNFSEKI
jgi:hypothetical protein